MATPIIYLADVDDSGGADGTSATDRSEAPVEPFADVPPERRTPEIDVFFASNREPLEAGDDEDNDVRFGNDMSAGLHLGEARLRIGDDSMTWDRLHAISRSAAMGAPPIIRLLGASELCTVPIATPESTEGAVAGSIATPSAEAASFLDRVREELAESSQGEIVIYIHGAKVDFYNACAFTAEIEHFLGRGFVPVAFSWPTHQDIFAYLFGEDVRRAGESTAALATLLGLLADGTSASRINIVCWSAGARVTSQALAEIAQIAGPAGRDRYRLGAVIFELPDVELSTFLERLPAIATIAQRPVITVTDDDEALSMAEIMMSGGRRAGKASAHSDPQQALLESLPSVEFVDVSWGKDERGFNIAGHRCWFRHPWGVTDLVMVLRYDLPPPQRGLMETELWRVWALPQDYPQRVRKAAMDAARRGEAAPPAAPQEHATR